METQSIDSLFKGISVSASGEVHPENPGQDLAIPGPSGKLVGLLPISAIQLTAEESQKIQAFQQSRLILGAAGAGSLICDEKCPFRTRCPLFKMKKAPYGDLCPFEANYVTERFIGWMKVLHVDEESIDEATRVTISNLVYLDLQEVRCLNILSDAKAATVTSIAVRDSDQDGKPISWEEVIHANAQRLNEITMHRRLLMKDFEVTPEAKTKKQRLVKDKGGADLASRQSNLLDKVRKSQEAKIIDVQAEK